MTIVFEAQTTTSACNFSKVKTSANMVADDGIGEVATAVPTSW